MKQKLLVAAAAVIVVAGLGACSSNAGPTPTGSGSATCPTAPIPVTVSVDQWGNIVEQLAGACGDVTTVISGATVGDPHDFEPSTGDIAAFNTAKLVVINGAGYDEWASKAIEANNSSATVVDAATVNNVAEGANPHLWYSPDYVAATANAVTEALKNAAPSAASYFDTQQSEFQNAMKPYFTEITKIKDKADGKTYVATESVFDYMAAAVGLEDLTPSGYQNAIANESEPSPGDISAFDSLLTSKKANVLVNNLQTEGAVPAQLVNEAKSSGVPVVGVTETLPSQFATFQQWQTAQLTELAKALGIT